MRHPSVISVCAPLTTAGSVDAPRENSRSTCGITTAKSLSMSMETTSLPKITTKQMADQSQAGSTRTIYRPTESLISCFRRERPVQQRLGMAVLTLFTVREESTDDLSG